MFVIVSHWTKILLNPCPRQTALYGERERGIKSADVHECFDTPRRFEPRRSNNLRHNVPQLSAPIPSPAFPIQAGPSIAQRPLCMNPRIHKPGPSSHDSFGPSHFSPSHFGLAQAQAQAQAQACCTNPALQAAYRLLLLLCARKVIPSGP